MLLTAIALSVVSWNRGRRVTRGPSRRRLLLLTWAILVLFFLQAGTFLPGWDWTLSKGTIVGLPLAFTALFMATALIVLCWPTGLAPRQRNSAALDGLVGLSGVAVAWGTLVLLGLPAFEEVRIGIFGSGGYCSVGYAWLPGSPGCGGAGKV
jgi:hypothetical protein